MDPASAIGVATAVLSIVNLIAKNVASLSDLQSRYNAADLRISLLIGQLSTVKAALNQMVKLLESDFGALRDLELNYDFSMSIRCVEAAVVVLDDKMSLLQRNAANKLTLRSKVNLIWDEKTMDDYLNLLNNQIHALGLLLTALQWCVWKPLSSIALKTDKDQAVLLWNRAIFCNVASPVTSSIVSKTTHHRCWG